MSIKLLITDVSVWVLTAVQGTNEQVQNENQNESQFKSVNILSRSQQQQINLML